MIDLDPMMIGALAFLVAAVFWSVAAPLVGAVGSAATEKDRLGVRVADQVRRLAHRWGGELGEADGGFVLQAPHPSHPARLHLSDRAGKPLARVQVPLLGAPAVRIVLEDALKGADPVLDDPRFDRTLHLQGRPDWLSAVLDAPTRQAMLQLAETGRFEVTDDRLSLEAAGLDDDRLQRAIRSLQDVAVALSVPLEGVPAALEVRSGDEPVPGTRALAAIRLMAWHPESPQAASVASRLEPRPWEVLKALEGTVDHHLDVFARCALEPEVADVLLPALLGHPFDDVRFAAVAALERLGTGASVAALEAAASGALKKAAPAAVLAIRERLGLEKVGGLSVVDDGGSGALSVAAEGRGAVAVVEGKG